MNYHLFYVMYSLVHQDNIEPNIPMIAWGDLSPDARLYFMYLCDCIYESDDIESSEAEFFDIQILSSAISTFVKSQKELLDDPNPIL